MNFTSRGYLLIPIAAVPLMVLLFAYMDQKYPQLLLQKHVLGTFIQVSGFTFPLLFITILLFNRRLKQRLNELKISLAQKKEEEHQRIQSIIEGTEVGTWDWNLQTGELVLNERWAELIGYTLQELEPIGLAMWERTVHPEDLKPAEEMRKKHLRRESDYYDAQFRQQHKDGSWRWINARGKIVEWSAEGTPQRMSGTHTDITEQKIAELALYESRAMLRHVLDTIPARVFWKDTNSTFLGCNQLLAEDLDQDSPDSLIGNTDYDFFSKEEADRFRKDDQAVISSGKAKIAYEEPLHIPGGQQIWLLTSKVPLRNKDGAIIGILGTYEDITLRKKTELELIKAKEEAEAASKAKDEFLAVMSHEMRTPLNPILGFADILLESCDTEPDKTYLQTILSSGHRQLALIDDILHYMRIVSERVELNVVEFNLLEFCNTLLDEIRPTARDLELSFRNDTPGQIVPDQLIIGTDLLMLRRILENLLNNSIKYTRAGSVTLNISMEHSDPPIFHFAVKDTGIGIKKSQQAHLFDPFSQVDASYTRKHEGIGLGLAICKKLTNLLGGQIDIQSSLGIGSTFTISLPLKVLAEPSKSPTLQNDSVAHSQFVRPIKVLIVDDMPDNLLIAEALVKSHNGSSTTANNGKEAIERCQQEKFDLILMDLSMPVMDGIDACEWIRKNECPNQLTPIIAITANVTSNIANSCQQAGMDAYLSKPIDSKEFYNTLNRLLN